jgi:hypothetical protein
MKSVLRSFLLTFLFSYSIFAQSNSIIQNIINETKIDSLMKYVSELSGAIPVIVNGQQITIASRNKSYPGNDQAANYLMQKLGSYGLTVTNQVFSSTGRNIYAVQTGTEFPNKKFIICGHYDSMPSGALAPGADDNASGTASVIEAARVFSNYSFPFTIVYALWDEEEQGLIGSAYYAQQASSAGDSILGVINLDMVAWDSNNDGVANIHSRPTAGNSTQLKDKMVEINSQYGINLTLVIKSPGSTYSDHASFWTHNYGAILLIEDENDFHAYYHTVNDLITHFNIPYFEKSVKLSLATLASFALNLNMTISHTPVASSDNTNNISISALIQTGLKVGTGNLAPHLYYRTKTGSSFSSFQSVAGTPAKGSETWNFVLPGQQLGTIVQYYLAAQDSSSSIVTTLPKGGSGFNPPGSTPPTSFFQYYVANNGLAFNDNATTISNWTVSGTWGITTSKYVSAPSSFTDSPAGNYANNATLTMTSTTPISLTDILGASLEFAAQWDIENDWDYGQVLISTNNGSTWTPLAGQYTNLGTGSFQPANQPLYDGVQSSWVNENIDLTQYIGNNILLRFLLKTDGSQVRDGWYVDDIKISTYNLVPVELIALTAIAVDNSVIINWSTASELNNKGFTVERMNESDNNNITWDELVFIAGHGTKNEITQYTFTDVSPLNGQNNYRLRQIDFDGTEKIYGPTSINFENIFTYSLEQNYPNPFNPLTTINWQIAKDGFVTLKVYDLLGREVANLIKEEMKAGSHKIKFNGSSLSSGVYLYELKSGDFKSTKKFVLMK